jgi:hypothetical protein
MPPIQTAIWNLAAGIGETIGEYAKFLEYGQTEPPT